ncbi:TOBE domain-containing protein [Methanococcus maripaludis]|jgi:molybdopterin-binding protein|uniref:Molybdenum-pterin-binding protein 2 n=4 Tax=Methanococcus maripaludis TaxID=39152 RepID=A0A2L1C8R4_METMI|nr:TOBE domain-containing protein [Methanococcus maripaludis]AVB75772.1 Molybdenum-pterin-binding protein 2 [Methanococcus maripaludis]MBA2841151.1 molybdopterin-binding protein [Methanococcus maripaludis]MBA2846438.1 molybdopterin-binding protein [Methanococcus maripaludis]MBA2850999.1 molybdopterin-binding protein [Methanococcus maripaludis]MBA2853706.1 molybdopterin-binding protein [Methanococcus maripaludis]
MKMSIRNQFTGKILEIVEGQVVAKVKVDIGGGNTIVSVITLDAEKELGLKVGDTVTALVKSTSVMIEK